MNLFGSFPQRIITLSIEDSGYPGKERMAVEELLSIIMEAEDGRKIIY